MNDDGVGVLGDLTVSMSLLGFFTNIGCWFVEGFF